MRQNSEGTLSVGASRIDASAKSPVSQNSTSLSRIDAPAGFGRVCRFDFVGPSAKELVFRDVAQHVRTAR